MSDAKGQHEPSMEEILASIRRIIAEDNEAPAAGADKGDKAAAPATMAAPPAAEPPLDDVLELTDVVEEDAVAQGPASYPAPAAPAAAAIEEPNFALPPEPPMLHVEPTAAEEARLLSAASAAASVSALSQLLVRNQRDRSSELPLGNINRTLEDLVLELMRPLLKTWLDEHLPPLVERIVRDEVVRLVHEAQGR
jgi:uncharacterized protein